MKRAKSFECVVTFRSEDSHPVRLLAGHGSMRIGDPKAWRFSVEVTGSRGVRERATCQLKLTDPSYDALVDRMGLLVDEALDRGLRPLRLRVAAVVYEVEFATNSTGGTS